LPTAVAIAWTLRSPSMQSTNFAQTLAVGYVKTYKESSRVGYLPQLSSDKGHLKLQRWVDRNGKY
jgi:hypothetical protein